MQIFFSIFLIHFTLAATLSAETAYVNKALLGERYAARKLSFFSFAKRPMWGAGRGAKLSAREKKRAFEPCPACRASLFIQKKAEGDQVILLVARKLDGSAVEELRLDENGKVLRDALNLGPAGSDGFAQKSKAWLEAKDFANPPAQSHQEGCCGKSEAIGLDNQAGGQFSPLPKQLRSRWIFQKLVYAGSDQRKELFFSSQVWPAKEKKPEGGKKSTQAVVKTDDALNYLSLFIARPSLPSQPEERVFAVGADGSVYQLSRSKYGLAIWKWENNKNTGDRSQETGGKN